MERVITVMQALLDAIRVRHESLQLRGLSLRTLPSDMSSLPWLTDLDISYNSLTSLTEGIYTLFNLRTLHANHNEIASISPRVGQLKRLQCLALARNRLCGLPVEVATLMHLETLNVSGNRIQEVPKEVLSLPKLRRLDVVRNGVVCPPREVCLSGVEGMREYYCISRLRSCPCTECTGETSVRIGEEGDGDGLVLEELADDFDLDVDEDDNNDSCFESADDEMDSQSGDQGELALNRLSIPSSGHCVIYTTDGRAFIANLHGSFRMFTLHSSFYRPLLESNEMLVTPVIAMEPHGSKFHPSQPAVIYLKHCAQLERNQRLVAMCSDTAMGHQPSWHALDQSDFTINGQFVVVKTLHFSLFTVKMIDPFPEVTCHLEVSQGGVITVPQVPGIRVHIPGTALDHDVNVTVKVLYRSEPGRCSQQNPGLVSPIVCITPHGLQFNPYSPEPVTVDLPIPNYSQLINTLGPGPLPIRLLYSPDCGLHQPLMWQPWHDNGHLILNQGEVILRFTTTHFSFYKTIIDKCASILQDAKLGAAFIYDQLRGFNVKVTCKALMTEVGPDNSFSLTIICYRFGTEPTDVGNYPISLGLTQRKTLRVGEVSVTLSGHFIPLQEVGQRTLTNEVEFDGRDFTTEFALKATDSMHLAGVIGRVVVESQQNEQYRFDMNLIVKELARDRSCARTSDELSTPIDRTVSEELSELEQALARQLDRELTSECLASVRHQLGLDEPCDHSLVALLRQAKRQDISSDQVLAALRVAIRVAHSRHGRGQQRSMDWNSSSTDDQDDSWDTASSQCFPPTPPACSTPQNRFRYRYSGSRPRKRKRCLSDDEEVTHTSLLSLSEHLGDDWERLALHLHFSLEEIQDISVKNSSLRERSMRMLSNWHRREGEFSTYGELYRALGKMKLWGLARHMESA